MLNDDEQFEDAPEQRLQFLANIAAQLGLEGSSEHKAESKKSGNLSTEGLSAEELEELERVKNALAFLNAAKLDNELPNSANASKQTLAEIAGGTLPAAGVAGSDEAGESVARFEIKQLIGEGGFAKVYLAYDPQLNRNVALKVLKSSRFDSDDARGRFEREAQAAAVLSHPNIVPVFEAGEADRQRYIASAFCDGITLEKWLEGNSGTASPVIAATIIATLAEAVEHAHQRRVIHRDLKPANILLESESANIESQVDLDCNALRIADFGLAKHAETTDLMETAEGAILGTPAYMSPEQAMGTKEVDGRTDIYSLGVMLYELLVGQVPIIGENHIATLLAINKNEIKPPRRLDGSIPRDLEAICLKCLRKPRSERYKSANELARDLNRWLSGDVVEARHATKFERMQKWCGRNPVVASALAVVSLALVFSVWQWLEARKQAEIAFEQSAFAQQYLGQMTGLVDGFLDDTYSRPASLMSKKQRSLLHQTLELQLSLANEEQGDVAIRKNRLRVYTRICRLQNALGENAKALETRKDALEWLGESSDWNRRVEDLDLEFVELVVELHIDGLDALTSSRKIDETVAAANRLEEIVENHASVFTETGHWYYLITTCNYRGLALKRGGRIDEAIEEFESAKRYFELLEQVESPLTKRTAALVGPLLINLASTLTFQNRQAESFECFEKANQILKSGLEGQPGELSMNVFRASCLTLWYHELRRSNHSKKNPEIDKLCDQKSSEALSIMERMIQIEPDNNEVLRRLASSLVTRAKFLSEANRLDESLAVSARVFALRGLSKSLQGAKFAMDNICLRGEVFQKQGKIDLAVDAADKAVKLGESIVARSNRFLAGHQQLCHAHLLRLGVVHESMDSEKFLECLPLAMTAIENSIAVDRSTYSRSLRHHQLGWVKYKSYHLVRLERWQDAAAAVSDILEIGTPKDPNEKSHFEMAATRMASVLNEWRKSLGDDWEKSTEFDAAAEQGSEWLKIAIQQHGFDKFESLKNDGRWKSLREHQSFSRDIVPLLPSE